MQLMSEDNNNQQQQGQEQEQDNKQQNQNQNTENNQQKSDKDLNFEKLRKQNQSLQKKLEAFEKKQAEAEKKKLEEEGKLQELLERERKEKEELMSKYQIEKRQTLLEKQLASSGINPEIADLILPSIQSQVEFGDDNQPTNLDEVIDNLKATKPSLFTTVKSQPAGQVGTNVTIAGNAGLSSEELSKILEGGDAELIAKHADTIRSTFKQ